MQATACFRLMLTKEKSLETLVKLNPFPSELWGYLSIDLSIALILLIVIRWLSGQFSKINVTSELSERDNFAFGISVAGRMLSLCLVLGSVVGRHVGAGYENAAIGMLLFGLISLWRARFCFSSCSRGRCSSSLNYWCGCNFRLGIHAFCTSCYILLWGRLLLFAFL